jgi:beta-lactamase regulating signal transducer with metallopeptidase domain
MTTLPAVLVWGLKATPLLLAAWAVTVLLRRASASTRHYVWVLALGATLVLPLVAVIAPRLEVTLPAFAAPEPATLVVAESGPAGVEPDPAWNAPDAPAGAWLEPSAPAVSAVSAVSVTSLATRVWATGAVAILLLVGISLWRTLRLARAARPLVHAGVAREVEGLARRVGVGRPVRILRAAGDAMPMTWGALRPTILVPGGFADWPAARRQAVLLHELAHVRRWDWITQLAARFACALYWWHPLVWVAARRLREERELACDDLVLAYGTVPSSYAGDLLEIARSFRPVAATALAGVAMARRSQLAGRLLAVLDHARARRSLAPRQAVSAAGAALVVLLPVAGLAATAAEPSDTPPSTSAAPAAYPGSDDAAPAPPATRTTQDATRSADPLVRQSAQDRGALLCNWTASSESNSSSTSINDERMMIQISRDDCSITVRAEGEITFTEDDRGVAQLPRRGFFEIEERSGRARRRVEVSEADGRLEHRWFVDGREQPYDDSARAWFGDALLVLVRRAGINAEARATRIFESRGADGLIAEIALLQSDYTASKYYRVLFERAELTSAQLVRLLDDAARRIDSDHEMGRVLATIAARRPRDAAVQEAYVRATDGIDSDHSHTEALTALVEAVDLQVGALDAMLASASRIDSDFQRARLLLAVAGRYPSDRPLPDAYLRAVGDMDSDHERGRVLGRLLERDRLSPADRARVLAEVGRIDSDHTQGTLLTAVASAGPLDEVTRASFFAAVGRVGSDFSRTQVLGAVMAGEPDEATTLAVLEAARGMDSDHSKGQVLATVAARGLSSDRIREAYLAVAQAINSRFERDRALRAAGLRGT